MASVAVGPMAPGATVPETNSAGFCRPRLVVALDRIADQIGEEIFDPLLQAASVEQLARTFERVFPKVRDYYASAIFIVWGWLQEDPQRFSALTIRSFQESEHLIRSKGARWIGQEASLNALHGLATTTRVAKAVGVFLDKQEPADLWPNGSDAEAWANALIAYVMAFSAVHASLAALADGRTPSARLEKVADLANGARVTRRKRTT
jgi:hypothetical protein